MTKRQKSAADKRISAVYRQVGQNVQIDVFDISKIYAVGYAVIAAGGDDVALALQLTAFLATIRKN